MTPEQYQTLASRTECDQQAASRKHYYIDREQELMATRLTHAALGISGESGELSGAVEKWINYGQPLDEINIKEELGDLMWYIALACNALSINLEDVMEKNIAKLKKRYPEKYSNEAAEEANRDREAEREVLNQSATLKKEEWIGVHPNRKDYERVINEAVDPEKKLDVKVEYTGPKPRPRDPMAGTMWGEQGHPPNGQCHSCKTPFSDHTPVYCPECGVEQ